MNKILIVEDDIYINKMLLETFTSIDYVCTQAFSGTEALLCIDQQEYNVIILDLMLPGMSGEVLLPKLKEKSNASIIVVSSKHSLNSKVELLSLGADDYITKPFEIEELTARVGVQFRKANQQPPAKTVAFKNMLLDKDKKTLSVSNMPIPLTRQELKIIELLLSYPNKIFSKQEIYEYAWDDFYVGEDKTVNVHISNIRQKIKTLTREDWIKTVWGIGFTLQK